ncbi:alpha-xylosidase [Marinococcus sp. PL1-022]|uniref:alpha-xylosidase n=1 Tax=Marinococcus sp. PL1-022 TaxID=3095363 RepID=UPI0029C43EB1|nr:alpha-xylosidase [Marinococcus sp. PL1-022]MDX6152302.1 alpha-xylosidase [Marinococcus sp. PL1-022]
MKFSDGNWLTREGYQLYHPNHITDYEISREEVIIYAPCKPIPDRGATLDGPLLTLKISSPTSNVLTIRVSHFLGGLEKRPELEFMETKRNELTVNDNDECLEIITGDLKMKLNKQQWRLEYFNQERKITESQNKNLAYIKHVSGKSYMREQLNIGVSEHIYGLGERFTPFVKNGQSIDSWNKDGGTSTEQAYKNIPFYISDRGYGLLVNHYENVSYEIGSEEVSKSQFSVDGEELEYSIINGPEPKKIIENYTDLTGKPALPPKWSFGLWLTTSFTTNYDEETVNHFVDGMKSRNIPLSVFHFDCFWMKEFEWCNFEWDERFFPDPEGMIKRLKNKGLSICVWINPYIAQKSPLFQEGKEKGYFIKTKGGDVWQWDLWQAGQAIVDFTNPEAKKWYQSKLEKLLDMGVDSFKTDFGERIPAENVTYYDGSDPDRMHNYYAQIYNETVFSLLKEKKGQNEAVVFARSATIGGQRFPVHWGGDCYATYESMAESLRGGLSLTSSGFGFWSHDIGGFENTASADLFKRWTAFGMLSTHSRLHGSSSYRVPWLFDEESVEVTKFFAELKNKLMPYLYNEAIHTSVTGIPMMQPMYMTFPDEKETTYLDTQYMLGSDLLVAPVFNEEGNVDYYLPGGKWTNYFTKQTIIGKQWLRQHFDYFQLPLYVRPHTLLPIGSTKERPDYDYNDQVCFELYEPTLNKPCTREIKDNDNNTLLHVEVLKENSSMKIVCKHNEHNTDWSVLWVNSPKIFWAKGAKINQKDNNYLITPENKEIFIELEEL